MTRILIRPIMILIGCVSGFFAADYISKEDDKYSMTKLTKTAETTSYWLSQVSRMEKGSGYNLGQIEFTPLGMLKKFPAAVNVTLFRPYLWESKNVVMLLSSLESLFFLYITLNMLFKAGIKKTFSIIASHPIIASSLVFSLTFAFAVGISTSNFGTLVRYKIPMMPFYLISILVIRSHSGKKKPSILQRNQLSMGR